MRVSVLSFSVIVLGALLVCSCAKHREAAVYPYGSGPRGERLDHQTLLAQNPLAEGEAMQVIALEKTPATSLHLVRIRTREASHRHVHHDATAILLQGNGTLHLERARIAMQSGDVVSIPRKAVHAYVNEGTEPSVFYVIFSPPFDGTDREIVAEPSD